MEDEGGAGRTLSALGSQVDLAGQKAQEERLLCGAGTIRDKMISFVWESCLFPNPSLSLSLSLKTTMAKDKVVSFAKLAVFFVFTLTQNPGTLPRNDSYVNYLELES